MKPNVLFVAAEALPLAKTGGLGDVVASLAAALATRGVEVTVLLPGYPQALAGASQLRQVGVLPATGDIPAGRLLAGWMPDADVQVALVDIPSLYDRQGGLYLDASGADHVDNAARFAALCHAAVSIARGDTRLPVPHVVHAHDWHAALVPPLLQAAGLSVPTVLTLHNLAFQGLFAAEVAPRIGLPPGLQTSAALEYWGQLSFLKAGIATADRLTTVSPNYAREILTPAFGHGLDGLLRERADRLSAVCNGIDDVVWNPAIDPLIARTYDAGDMKGKAVCKRVLQQDYGLTHDPFAPLLAIGSRITTQKMADTALPGLMLALQSHPRLQVAVLGVGEAALEEGFRALAAAWPGRVGVHIGYSEAQAHALHAGADMLLHGSRFEPFGLTPVYAMRYGTLPIASRVGGLIDTVIDPAELPPATPSGPRRPTGFAIDGETPEAVAAAIGRALDVFVQPPAWHALQRTGMHTDFSWRRLAGSYVDLYSGLAGEGSGADWNAAGTAARGSTPASNGAGFDSGAGVGAGVPAPRRRARRRAAHRA